MANWHPIEQSATGPNGEKMGLVNGQWYPISQSASNKESGEKMGYFEDESPFATKEKPPETPAPETPAGSPEQKKMSPFESSMERIAHSGAAGAIAGAATPEVLVATGKGMEKIGQVASKLPSWPGKVGAGVQGAGKALQALGMSRTEARVGDAILGGLAGITGQTTEEVMTAMKAPTPVTFATRMGVEMATGAAEHLTSYMTKAGGFAWRAFMAAAHGTQENVSKATEAAMKNLKGVFKDLPQNDLHAFLAKQEQEMITAAKRAYADKIAQGEAELAAKGITNRESADRLMEPYIKAAERIRSEGFNAAAALRSSAGKDLATATRVQALSQAELQRNIAPTKELTQIGDPIRKEMLAVEDSVTTMRRDGYQSAVKERDAIVKEKESSGIRFDKLPEIQALKTSLNNLLLSSKKAVNEAIAAAPGHHPVARVSDPELSRVLKNMQEAISNKRIQTGVNEEGNPTYTYFVTGFEAFDHVRRRLGEAIAGRPAEGWGGLKESLAREWYAKISAAQKSYAGPVQEKLQKEYAEFSGELASMRSSKGQKITATDPADREHMIKDAASIPGMIFKSNSTVQDAIELTRNAPAVEQAGREYAANQLQGKSASQIKEWINNPKNRDWLSHPAFEKLRSDLNLHLKRAEQIERIPSNLKNRMTESLKKAESTVEGTMQRSKGMVKEGQSVADTFFKEQQSIAENQLKGIQNVAGMERDAAIKSAKIFVDQGMPAVQVNSFIRNATQDQIGIFAKYVAGTPGGGQKLAESMRFILGTMSPKTMEKTWTTQIEPIAKAVLPPAQYNSMLKDVQKVMSTLDQKAALKMTERIVLRYLSAQVGHIGGMAGPGTIGQLYSTRERQ